MLSEFSISSIVIRGVALTSLTVVETKGDTAVELNSRSLTSKLLRALDEIGSLASKEALTKEE